MFMLTIFQETWGSSTARQQKKLHLKETLCTCTIYVYTCTWFIHVCNIHMIESRHSRQNNHRNCVRQGATRGLWLSSAPCSAKCGWCRTFGALGSPPDQGQGYARHKFSPERSKRLGIYLSLGTDVFELWSDFGSFIHHWLLPVVSQSVNEANNIEAIVKSLTARGLMSFSEILSSLRPWFVAGTLATATQESIGEVRIRFWETVADEVLWKRLAVHGSVVRPQNENQFPLWGWQLVAWAFFMCIYILYIWIGNSASWIIWELNATVHNIHKTWYTNTEQLYIYIYI